MKHIFVTGGVVSSLGKGIATASIGALLRARGYTVAAVKIDPYINVDAGTMRPYEHGEVFVTKDGAETDLDLGHYERFLDTDHLASNSVTTGKVYLSVIQKERRGDYLSKTVQVIPHITDEIKAMVKAAAEAQKADMVVVEVGGTVGDIESLPFLEAIRQFRFDHPPEDTLYVHLTLVPRLGTTGELKTKPTQHSVATLRGVGIQPDIILVRSEDPIPEETRKKIALFTNVRADDVFSSYDVDDIYQVPLVLEEQGLGKTVEKKLALEATFPNLTVWQEIVSALSYPERVVRIGIAGKYTRMPDAYLSLLEALKHGGIPHKTRVEIRWIDSEELSYKAAPELLAGLDGILVPGGFGVRGIEGKIVAAGYARSQKIPYLGLCLGLQIAVVEFARNVAGLANANSREFDPYTPYPVIDLMPEQQGIEELGGTMRLGDWPMEILEGSHLHRIYGKTRVFERHRHRYEVNPNYVETLSQAGLVISGITPGMDGHGQGLVEAIELADHPFFLASQFHPEFKSRPMRPAPLFVAFVAAALAYSDRTKTYANSPSPAQS